MTSDSALVTSSVDPDISAALVLYERIQPLQDALGLKDLTIPEMHLFAMVAHHTGLDPFTKQIYAIKRGGKVTHQTGIDGYRSTAEKTKEYRGSDAAEFETCDCDDPGSPKVHPSLATVTVYRAYPDGIRPQVGEARWHELKPKHTQNKNGFGYQDDMWWQMPWNQLAKCAEANGLRKAFPRVLGGVYISEEMQQVEIVDGQATDVTPRPSVAERVAQRRAQIERPVETPAEPTEDVVEGEAVDAPETVQSQAAARVVQHRAERVAAQGQAGGAVESIDAPRFADLLSRAHIPATRWKPAMHEINPDAQTFADLTDVERGDLWGRLV